METRTRDKQVLRLLFAETAYSEEDLHVALDGLDIDQEKTDFLLPLALLGIRHNWAYFPASLKPRLEGIYQAARLRNMVGIPWLKTQLDGLRSVGIPVMFVKGMAMRSYYAPGVPREMSDFDVAVPEDRYKEAAAILMRNAGGNKPSSVSLHARHIYGQEKSIDLHHRVFKMSRKATDLVWKASVTADFQGLEVSVPSPIDMFIHVVESKSRDEITGAQPGRRLKWLFDARYLLQIIGDVDWKLISSRADELGVRFYLTKLLPVFSDVFPDCLNAADLQLYFPKDTAFRKRETQIEHFAEKNRLYRKKYVGQKPNRYPLTKIFSFLHWSWLRYYNYMKPDFKIGGIQTSFWGFLCESYEVENITQLFTLFIKKAFLHRD